MSKSILLFLLFSVFSFNTYAIPPLIQNVKSGEIQYKCGNSNDLFFILTQNFVHTKRIKRHFETIRIYNGQELIYYAQGLNNKDVGFFLQNSYGNFSFSNKELYLNLEVGPYSKLRAGIKSSVDANFDFYLKRDLDIWNFNDVEMKCDISAIDLTRQGPATASPYYIFER